MKKTDRPSEYFLGMILRAYDKARKNEYGAHVTPSKIWNYVVMECLANRDFVTPFAWDTSTAKKKNRIRDIAECLKQGLVPGLELALDERGHEIVVEGEKWLSHPRWQSRLTELSRTG